MNSHYFYGKVQIKKKGLKDLSMLTMQTSTQATIQDNARQVLPLLGGRAQAGKLAWEGHVPHRLETGPQVGVRVYAPLECQSMGEQQAAVVVGPNRASCVPQRAGNQTPVVRSVAKKYQGWTQGITQFKSQDGRCFKRHFYFIFNQS